MKIFLRVLMIYVLDPNLIQLPKASDEDFEEIKGERKKHEENELVCRGNTLNTLLNLIYDLFTQ